MKGFRILFAAVALAALFCLPAQAAGFPDKEVTLNVPLSPGGGSDLTMRALARAAETPLGKPVVVVNKPGAGGAVGLTEVSKMKPDGYNLVMLSEYIYNLPMTQALGFKADDFGAICTVNFDSAALAVGKDSKLKTLAEFIDYAKANPGVLTLGNSGFGNIWHISAVGLEKATGAQFTHVPFGGAAPTITATLGGHVSGMIASVPEMSAQAQAGELIILAVLGDTRNPAFPDVPTAKEQGIDVQFGSWRGVGLPKGADPAVVAALEKVFKEAAESREFKDFMAKQGFNILWRDSAATAAYMRNDAPRFGAILDEMGLLKK
jgi:tripartite-type tricarboxylate transporter receptor subunit TctC